MMKKRAHRKMESMGASRKKKTVADAKLCTELIRVDSCRS